MGTGRTATSSIAMRALSSVALALALLSQATTLVHMAAVRHETCAEHGELVEGDGDAHSSAPVTSTSESDAHEHCLLATTPSFVEELTRVSPVIAVTDVDTNVAVPRERVVHASVLRVAPKTSPPLV